MKRCEQPPTAKTKYTLDEAKTKVDSAYDNYEEGRPGGYEKPSRNSDSNEQEHSGRRLKATKLQTSP